MPVTLDWSKSKWFVSHIETARREGREAGLQAGLAAGLKAGRQEGLAAGREKGREKGRKEGREEGREEGQQEGVKQVVRLLLEKRFGRLPSSIAKRLAKLSDAQAQELALSIIDAKSLKELFGSLR